MRKPLRLGYVMVKNASQRELNEKPLAREDARDAEMKFFQTHDVFSKYIDRELFGVERLTRSLTELLATHIRRTLPSIQQELKALSVAAEEELQRMGPAPCKDIREVQSSLVKRTNVFCQTLRQSSCGEYRDKLGLLATSAELRLHAQIAVHFKKMQESILQQRPVFDGTTAALQLVQEELVSQRGRELPGFLNTHAFSSCIVSLVEEWRVFVEECANAVVSCTLKVAASLSQLVMRDLPRLREKMDSLAETAVTSAADALSAHLDALLSREQDPFTTQDVLLEVVNSIRFRTFDAALRQVLECPELRLVADKRSLEEEVKKRLGKCLRASCSFFVLF